MALNWLYSQLPELVDKGVLSAETAERIREYYGPPPAGLVRWTVMTVFGLIGCVLLGLGIILILGHNWDRLDHLTRLLISLGLLLAAQGAAALALWRKKDSVAWREGAASFLMLAVGASIALVGQTYHLADDFKTFVLVWMLLSWPLVYLMDAKSVAGMYLVGITAWMASVQDLGTTKQMVWALMAVLLPYYGRLLKTDRYSHSAVVLSWMLILCFYICFHMSGEKHLWKLLYSLLFSATYFVGLLWFGDGERNWKQPFQAVGLLGSVGMAYFLSFKMSWSNVYLSPVLADASREECFLALGLALLLAGLAILLKKRGLVRTGLNGALPVVVAGGYWLHSLNQSGMYAAALLSFYLLGLSISLIWQGARETRLGLLNLGMMMLAALVLLRFFDFNYSFIVRGVAFIFLGLAFLIVNWVMSRRKKGVEQ
ncbi:MAG TPA: DUF2157 domain-containing protein [Patescibacteria group bacterium]|nr:DUF2157 domain-containing protein [Patescibacteria group bacterium]